MDPISVVSVAKGAVDLANGLRGLLSKDGDKSEITGEMLKLQGVLAENLAAISNLIQENHDLKDAIRRLQNNIEDLEEKLKFNGELEYRNNCYLIKGDSGASGGRFCSGCWDSNRTLIRLHIWPNGGGGKCPTCDKTAQFR